MIASLKRESESVTVYARTRIQSRSSLALRKNFPTVQFSNFFFIMIKLFDKNIKNFLQAQKLNIKKNTI